MRKRLRVKALAVGTVLAAHSLFVTASGVSPRRDQGQNTQVIEPSTTVLPDGRVLQVGGSTAAGPSGNVAIWDPVSGLTMSVPARLAAPRTGHTATLLPDGTVLIIGGRGAP